MIKIRGRYYKNTWKEVTEQEAIKYGNVLIELLGFNSNKDQKIKYLSRFIKGLDFNKLDFMKEEKYGN